jgi:hypothetical protein
VNGLASAKTGYVKAGVMGLLALVLMGAERATLEVDLVSRWYTLLARADEIGLSGMLAANAKIQLDDTGVTQNKRQFLASLDGWRETIKDGNIQFKLETASAGAATALVCYKFSSNDLLTRERFQIVSGRITYSRQSVVAQDCNSF